MAVLLEEVRPFCVVHEHLPGGHLCGLARAFGDLEDATASSDDLRDPRELRLMVLVPVKAREQHPVLPRPTNDCDVVSLVDLVDVEDADRPKPVEAEEPVDLRSYVRVK